MGFPGDTNATPLINYQNQMPPPAGFWIRALARLVDIAVVNVIGVAAISFSAMLVQGAAVLAGNPATGALSSSRLQGLELIAGLFGSLAYQTIMEGLYGTSVGKIMFGLHVFRVDGSPCNLWCAAVRSLAYLIDSLFFGAVAFLVMNRSPLRQRLGDLWAGSVVVNLRAKQGFSPDWGLFLSALFWAVVACALLSSYPVWIALF